MATASNATPTGLITVSGTDTVERVVGDCDVTITGYASPVTISIDLWESMNQGGTHKFMVARLRRDSVTGTILATKTFAEETADSTGGHQQRWNPTPIVDSTPTTGRYVLTMQSTPNASTSYSDTHSLSLSAPDLVGAIGVPATATASAPAGAAGGAALAPGAAATATALAPAGIAGVRVSGAAATATATAVAGVAHSYQPLTAYDLDANSSQALRVRVGLSAVLETDLIPVAPPAGLVAAQVSILKVTAVMPTPTIGSDGKPT